MPALPLLELIWADGGYNAWQVEAALAKVPRLRMEIVKRSDDTKGFVVLPRRRIMPLGAIPQTFGSSSSRIGVYASPTAACPRLRTTRPGIHGTTRTWIYSR